MRAHKLAEIFPLLEGSEFETLKADIAMKGVLAPIVTCQGEILDGRNRYRACQALGIECPAQEYAGDDPLAFVLSLNLHRRHLNESQRAIVAARLANLKDGQRADYRRSANLPTCSQAQAASLLNVSERSIRAAIKVKDQGTPELVQLVDQGGIAVSQAEHLAEKPVDDQRRIVALISGGIKPIEAVRQVRKQDLIGRALSLPEGIYRVIYVDPPWRYNDSRALCGYNMNAAEEHYPTMSTQEICNLEVRRLAADDAILFLWGTFPLYSEPLTVIKAWGFAYKQAFIWDKGAGAFGHYHDAAAEPLLVATRGSCLPLPDHRENQIQRWPRGRHSEKPAEFRAMIDRLYPHGPRIELFARGELPPPWVGWGNEVTEALAQ